MIGIIMIIRGNYYGKLHPGIRVQRNKNTVNFVPMHILKRWYFLEIQPLKTRKRASFAIFQSSTCRRIDEGKHRPFLFRWKLFPECLRSRSSFELRPFSYQLPVSSFGLDRSRVVCPRDPLESLEIQRLTELLREIAGLLREWTTLD